ncbi:MAG: 30S ribosomal protein S4 [Chloroflexi bacterium]|nr:30S ribosomal protein S4 [Chloroflexota bacterium]
MARYTGPACRQCRRQGIKLFLKGERCFGAKCAVERRSYAPGDHGQRRRKTSEFGAQLREKQKARSTYGVLEQQFRKHFEEAERRTGITGENLLQILECRLDNVVYRLGLAESRRQARQLVRHGHFALNGRKTNIPSALVRPGDAVAVLPGSRDTEYFKTAREALSKKSVPTWLELDPEQFTARVAALPTRQQIETNINEALVVEFYSR